MACLSGISCMLLIVSIFGLIVYADCASCCKGWMTVDARPSNAGRCPVYMQLPFEDSALKALDLVLSTVSRTCFKPSSCIYNSAGCRLSMCVCAAELLCCALRSGPLVKGARIMHSHIVHTIFLLQHAVGAWQDQQVIDSAQE